MSDTSHFPANRVGVLARDAHNLAIHVRALERHVADAVDVPACLPARESALQLEHLADLLREVGR